MKLVRTFHVHPALFNVVPLINVIFLVLIFFALSSRFVLQPGMAISLPVSTFTLGPQRDARIVSITAAPVPAIYFQDEQVSLEELRRQLAADVRKDRTLIIRADQRTPYNLVVQITGEGLKLGFSVVLATDSEQP
ncbi:MAG TPA: biopolymer transporter ExbD [Chthoniobacteraceae bacterium]